MPMHKKLAALTAAIVWAALALQLALTVSTITNQGATVLEALWRFFGYFTILTNLGVAIVATAMLVKPESPLARSRARLIAAASILLVGVVYSLALRSVWSPQGWQAVADHALHDAAPVLFLLTWIFAGHGSLTRFDALYAMIPPLAYLLYALDRAGLDGWYAYWFLDLNQLSGYEFIRNAALIALAFYLMALALVALDYWLANRRAASVRISG